MGNHYYNYRAGTNKAVLIKISILIFLFCPFICGAHEFPTPETTYTWEDGYNTQGHISVLAPKEKIDAILWNYSDYENWLLEGLSKDDPEARKLTCFLNSMEYLKDRNMFKVYFSLNIWFLKNKESSALFSIIPAGKGVDGIKLELNKGKKTEKTIDSLCYSISITHKDGIATINYTAHCKLKGPTARFFTLKLYKKNIEWYIRTFANNFLEKLES